MATKVDIAPEDYKEKYGFSDSTESYAVRGIRGLNEEVIKYVSRHHYEPIWMEQLRLRALKHFMGMKVPAWAPELGQIDYQSFYYYARPTAKTSDSWDQVPEYIKKTYDKLGVTEAEQKFLSGVGAIYESESVYHSIQKDLERQGVIFSDTVTALKQYPDIMKKYFGTVVPYQDNYIAALQTAVWSAGSFVWVPDGVKVGMPLQAYFRMNERNMGQFERTLIIAEPYSEVNYIEGCTAPVYSSQSLHSAIVEMIAKKGSLIKYTTLQKGARNAKSTVRCDALLIDDRSTTATYPYMEIQEDDATVTHEASVGKVGEELLFYLMSRGLSEGDALSMVVNGFLEPFAKELPMTYAVELNRLMALEMTNAVG